jgi:hypothetical protein
MFESNFQTKHVCDIDRAGSKTNWEEAKPTGSKRPNYRAKQKGQKHWAAGVTKQHSDKTAFKAVFIRFMQDFSLHFVHHFVHQLPPILSAANL